MPIKQWSCLTLKMKGTEAMDTKKGAPESAPLLNGTTRKDTNFIDSTLINNELNTLSEKFKSLPTPGNEPSENDILAGLLAGAEIDLTEDLQKPPCCLFIDDEPVFYLGDISTTIGKAKGRKTFATGLFLAAIAGNTKIQQRITGDLPFDKQMVLYFDTEQGKYHAQKAAKRVPKLLQVETLPNFKAYQLREFNPEQRLSIIEHAIYSTPNLGFVCIDGIRDVITSINDEEQATMITSKLLKWSGELGIHINCILHMNKGDNNARGHVGTELMNKSLSVLGVNKHEKQTEYSTIEAIASRDKEPQPLTFGINSDGLPFLLEPEQMEILQKLSEKNQNKNKTLQPDSFLFDTHQDNLKFHVFKNQSEQIYSELISNIKLTYNIGANKAGDFLTYFQNERLIEKINVGTKSKYILAF